jgi:two-component system chemotaxis response regulator CheY
MPKRLDQISVLIIEDETHTRHTIRSQLRQIGVRHIAEASDGERGILELIRARPDIVLCDVHMEPVGGREFLERVRANQLAAIKWTPIIFLTADAEKETVLFAKDHQVTGYLVKPINANQLKERISLALGMHV